LRSPPRAPYLSFSLSHNPVTRHTYLALISRSAHLIIYENEEPEDLTSWTELDRILVCDTPARGEEVSFRIQFDPNPEPCYTALKQGVPREAISLIVASMSKATIWRTKEISHSVSLGSSTSKEFYLAAELKGHRGLVRDVAWAPGNVRFVRVYELSTPLPSLPPVAAKGTAPPQTLQAAPLRSKDFSSLPPHAVVPARSSTATENGRPSGIGAGLAGARPWTSSAISSSSAPSSSNARDRGREGEVLHVVKEVSKMEANRSPVWRVDFDDDGQVLGSCGDDGKLILYRREPSGVWSKSSELAMTRSVIN
jgi:nucleoporin SEH1